MKIQTFAFYLLMLSPILALSQENNSLNHDFSLEIEGEFRYFFEEGSFDNQEQIFPINGLSGKQIMENARIKLLYWLEMRWNYGFTEFYSSVYYISVWTLLSGQK